MPKNCDLPKVVIMFEVIDLDTYEAQYCNCRLE